MRRACAGLALLLLGGCFSAAPGRPTGLVERLKPFSGPRGADAIILDVAVLEQPVGDRFLNDGLWAATDEQVIDLDHKAILEDNGFRVGLVGGILPAEFLALLTDDRGPDRRRTRMRTGNVKPLSLGDPRPQLSFQLQTDGTTTPVELPQAQCVLQVTPAFAPDGAVKLAFVPVVQYGAKVLWPLPGEGEVPLHAQRPTQRFPALGWEVTLSGTGYVVIGTRFDKADTLGHRFFLSTEGTKPVQRLLAIRASRLAPESTPEGSDATTRTPTVAPLALQAIATTRGMPE